MSTFETVNAGFLPLTDCMILVAAKEKGFAGDEGIDFRLSKQMSWASIRDHMAVEHYDVAHMLAPMPIAFNEGSIAFAVPLIAPMALGLGGNAITVSVELWNALLPYGATDNGDPRINGEALCKLNTDNVKSGKDKLRFGVVHPFSGHNLELRYWLSACGINPVSEVELLIVPPPLMPDALAKGQIDGYCVGEPWNTIAVRTDVGRILTTKSAIWHSSPEKVLGVRESWSNENPQLLSALIRALHKASKWCAEAQNHEELANILAKPEYLNVPKEAIKPALMGMMEIVPGHTIEVNDFLLAYDRAATFPWQSHALWFYSQMVRWGLIEHTAENLSIAKKSYRPDLYRHALKNTDVALPSASMKVEGALKIPTAVASTGRLMLGPDGFFDGKIFDPDQLETYLASLKV